jgi:hypothetical protein
MDLESSNDTCNMLNSDLGSIDEFYRHTTKWNRDIHPVQGSSPVFSKA